MRFFLVVVFVCAAVGCGDDEMAVLAVDLRTDFVAGVEFSSVRTSIDEGASERAVDHAVSAVSSYLDGVRVAELDLSAGTYSLRVELLANDGRIVAGRPVSVRVAGNTGITVVVTRDCAGVTCPAPSDDATATACLGGRCVSPECTVETPEACGTPDCTTAADCPAGSACTTGDCVGGACVLRAGSCPAGRFCDPETGCEATPDAGSVDAGASDAATADGGVTDGGAPDAGTLDAGPCPGACSSCLGGTCVIMGNRTSPALTCPDGIPCEVRCDTMSGACPNPITCGDGPCQVICGSATACANEIDCTRASSCDVDCLSDDTCGNRILCGTGSCNVQCGIADTDGQTSCQGVIACDTATDCTIACNGISSCAGEISCGPGPCDVNCEGGSSCAAAVRCGAASTCDVACNGGSACGATIDCGTSRCTVDCVAGGTCSTVDCQTACACDVTCSGGADCGAVMCRGGTTCEVGRGCSSTAAPACSC